MYWLRWHANIAEILVSLKLSFYKSTDFFLLTRSTDSFLQDKEDPVIENQNMCTYRCFYDS